MVNTAHCEGGAAPKPDTKPRRLGEQIRRVHQCISMKALLLVKEMLFKAVTQKGKHL